MVENNCITYENIKKEINKSKDINEIFNIIEENYEFFFTNINNEELKEKCINKISTLLNAQEENTMTENIIKIFYKNKKILNLFSYRSFDINGKWNKLLNSLLKKVYKRCENIENVSRVFMEMLIVNLYEKNNHDHFNYGQVFSNENIMYIINKMANFSECNKDVVSSIINTVNSYSQHAIKIDIENYIKNNTNLDYKLLGDNSIKSIKEYIENNNNINQIEVFKILKNNEESELHTFYTLQSMNYDNNMKCLYSLFDTNLFFKMSIDNIRFIVNKIDDPEKLDNLFDISLKNNTLPVMLRPIKNKAEYLINNIGFLDILYNDKKQYINYIEKKEKDYIVDILVSLKESDIPDTHIQTKREKKLSIKDFINKKDNNNNHTQNYL